MVRIGNDRLRGLSQAEIESALRTLCEPFGGLGSVSFTTNRSGERLCFIKLAVVENQTRLYSVLEGRSFADCFVVRIPVQSIPTSGATSSTL